MAASGQQDNRSKSPERVLAQSKISSKSPERVLAQSKISRMVDDWPPNLRHYIERCYTKCQSCVDQDLVELILKGKISSAQRDGIVFTKDWDNEPLPNLSRVS